MKKLLTIAIICISSIIAFIWLLFGCSSVPIINLIEITKAISCPYADDITCQKCHPWKKEVTNWHNPETGKLGKVEIILPESVNINFNSGLVVIINPNLPSKDWVCENVFYQFSGGLYMVQILYNRWSISSLPPLPPLALINLVYPSFDSEIPNESQYWIYKNNIPVEVNKGESDLYIEGLRGGVKI